MLIFGSRSKQVHHHTGPAPVCPICGFNVSHFVEKRHDFTFFFAPVAKTGGEYYIVCARCGNVALMNQNDFFNTINASRSGFFGYPSPVFAPACPVPVAQIPCAAQTQPNNMIVSQPLSEDEINVKIKSVVAATNKKYRRTGLTRTKEVEFFDKTFPYCPFCGKISNWSCDSTEGFKRHFRCDNCLGEFYGVPHIKKPEKDKYQVKNLGYFNKSALEMFKLYSIQEIKDAAHKHEKQVL